MGFFDDLRDEAMRRARAKKDAADAMDMYKKQQAEAEKAIGERKAQQAMERRVINEKQIRSLRASFRRPGIMVPPTGVQSAAAPQSSSSMQPMEQSASA